MTAPLSPDALAALTAEVHDRSVTAVAADLRIHRGLLMSVLAGTAREASLLLVALRLSDRAARGR